LLFCFLEVYWANSWTNSSAYSSVTLSVFSTQDFVSMIREILAFAPVSATSSLILYYFEYQAVLTPFPSYFPPNSAALTITESGSHAFCQIRFDSNDFKHCEIFWAFLCLATTLSAPLMRPLRSAKRSARNRLLPPGQVLVCASLLGNQQGN